MRIRRMSKIVITLIMALLLVFTAACAPAVTGEEEEEVTSEPGMEWGIIEIRVTDPPPADVKTAVVHLNNIEVHKVSGNTSGWIKILEAPEFFDLMNVIGVEKVLGSANVTAGSFTQIRMDVTKVTGNTTDNVPYTANVTGDKLKIVRPFNVGAGKVTVLTLDFDGEKSLIRTGRGEFLFKPVVKLLIEKTEADEEDEELEEVTIEGTIDNMPVDAPWIGEWVIAGQTVTVNADTVIEGTPEINLVAKVEALVQPDGSLLAIKIEVQE